MSVRQAATIPHGTELNADICIVGGGAAGITIARQLNGANLDVVVLEAGAFERDIAAERDTFKVEHIGVPWLNPNPDRGRWFGGSTNLWFGRIALPDAIDFEHRPWVPHSGWPLTLDELTPWLHVAGDILDVKHFDKMGIEHWRDYPTFKTFSTDPRANLASFLWADGMYMAPVHRKLLEKSRNVQLLLDTTATELIADDTGSVIAALSVRTSPTSSFTVKATKYVLAAGGLENPRLLLASTQCSPGGLGNEHDQVGRYYMEHPRGEGSGEVGLHQLTTSQIQSVAMLGERINTRYGKAQLRLTFSSDMQRKEELLNNSLHGHLVDDIDESAEYDVVRRWRRSPNATDPDTGPNIADAISASLRIAPKFIARGVRRIAGTARPTKLVLVDQMEQEPDPSSRITVNLRERDQFSLPRLLVDWRIGESTYRSQRRMHVLAKEILSLAGIRDFRSKVLDRPGEQPELWDMKHPMGTTRMADSPRAGVVDRHCRVHGVKNLYVAGSSVFPTAGHANPTLLLVALAARLADHLRDARTS